jgi:4-alpha-glucanotransferase
MNRRSSGLLLHLTSLPGPFGIGDMGPEAYRFVDFLAAAGQGHWQMLPLTPTLPEHRNSPYHSTSAFAGNPLLISPELLVEDGLLDAADTAPPPEFADNQVDYAAAAAFKTSCLEHAYEAYCERNSDPEFDDFCRRHAPWLDDYVLFEALCDLHEGRPWNQWPQKVRVRDRDTLAGLREKLAGRLQRQKFLQYLFYKQWTALKRYCRQRQVQTIGDMPIYLPYNSADVWSHPELYKLDDDDNPTVVSGVPPDYFSATGQLWGHPIYRWEAHRKTGYRWWVKRLKHQLAMTEMVRIDHFRGLVACWEVAAGETTAVGGRWEAAPGIDFFHSLAKHFACLPLIAEDLGTITPDVREVMRRFQLPGMRVLLFAFGDDFPGSAFLPHRHVRNCILYTGTHDNNTVKGWFQKEAGAEERERLFRYLGREIDADEVAWEMNRLAMMSVADTVILPVQDLLGLGAEARMNHPAGNRGNWRWRLLPGMLSTALAARLLELVQTYERI